MIVSLEAIFLSTFVMISQNRTDAKRQVFADQQWRTCRPRSKQNENLLRLSTEILGLTKPIHASTMKTAGGAPAEPLAGRQLTQGSRSRVRSTVRSSGSSRIGEIAVD